VSRKIKPPSYLRNGNRLARCVLRWPDGRVENRSLGEYGSPESYAAHGRAVAEWRDAWAADTADRPTTPAGPVRTVADLIARHWAHEEDAGGVQERAGAMGPQASAGSREAEARGPAHQATKRWVCRLRGGGEPRRPLADGAVGGDPLGFSYNSCTAALPSACYCCLGP
jgi:hypothetical protein